MPTYQIDGATFQSSTELTPNELTQLAGGTEEQPSEQIQSTEQPAPNGFDAASSALDKATSPSQPSNNTGLVEGVVGDVTRGALNSFAGTVDKINAANSLLKNTTTIDLSNGNLENVSKALKEQADAQPKSNNPIVAGASQFLGSIPDALAEFAGSGGGVGFVARSAALTALDAYNKDNNVGSLIKGAVVGGTVGLALNKMPEVLDKAAQLSKKWGETAGKTYLKILTGMTEKDATTAMTNINKYDLNPKSIVEDYGEVKKQTSQDLSDFKDNNNALISQQKENLTGQYQIAKEKSQQFMQDLRDTNVSMVQDLKDTHTSNMIELMKSNSSTVMEATDKATQDSADAIMKQVQATTSAKNALDNEMISLFDTARQKLNAMMTGIQKNVGMARNVLEKDGKDYIPTDVIQFELDKAISKNSGKFYKNISSGDGKSLYLMGTAGTNTPSVVGAMNLINSVRANLVNDFLKTGKTSLSAIDANQTLLEGAISKGFKGESLPKDLAKILSDVKASLSLTRSTSDTGEKIPGLFDKYPKELGHLKPLAEANSSYSGQIDGLKNSLSLYSDNIEGSLVPNPDKVFKALDSNNRSFITRLQEADRSLPQEDRIFGKIKDVYDNYKYVENSEKVNLSQIQKNISQNRAMLKTKLNEVEGNLKLEQQKQLRETVQSLTSKKQIFSTEQDQAMSELQAQHKEILNTLKQQKDKELEVLQSSVNDRLEHIHLQSTLRGGRANAQGLVRIGQNVGTYKQLNAITTLNPGAFLVGSAMSRVLSPIHGANIVKSAINAPGNTAGAKKILSNKVLKALLATKASGR